MTRPQADVLKVAALLGQGESQAEAARRTGVPRGTLRYWVKQGLSATMARRSAGEGEGTHRS